MTSNSVETSENQSSRLTFSRPVVYQNCCSSSRLRSNSIPLGVIVSTKRVATGENFQNSLWSSIALGGLAAGTLYALVVLGPLNFTLLRRYALGHPVSVAAVCLFAVALAGLVQKIIDIRREQRLLDQANDSLLDLMQLMPQAIAISSVQWLDSMWRAQPGPLTQSYFGRRFSKLLKRQIQRGSCEKFDQDLQDLADQDADAQHDSYSLVRIICWAMPMLGFLGTVIGISETLGNMDMKSLASGEGSAMDSLTAGLYIAFDTTAVGLVLTIFAMFMQFAISGNETRLLARIDQQIADRCYVLVREETPVDTATTDDAMLETLAVRVLDGTAAGLNKMIEQQQTMWSESMDKAQTRWVKQAKESGKILSDSLQTALDHSLGELSKSIERTQNFAVSSLEARNHQWQTTFSEQSRAMLQQQSELLKQSELLTKLVDRCDQFAALDQSAQQTLARLTDVDRFHEAAICLTEAIAVLGIQLERSGEIGRMVRATPTANKENLFAKDAEPTLPINGNLQPQRKAA